MEAPSRVSDMRRLIRPHRYDFHSALALLIHRERHATQVELGRSCRFRVSFSWNDHLRRWESGGAGPPVHSRIEGLGFNP
jgi:hypothetical protein